MGYVLVTEPVLEPVTLEEAKAQCTVDHIDDDALLGGLISAARQHFERETRRTLIDTVWRLDLDGFPCEGDAGRNGWPVIRLGHGRVSAVDSVTYLDTTGVQQTLVENTDYLTDYSNDIGLITPPVASFRPWLWPITYRRPGAVSVTYTAGYGPNRENVPRLARQAILMLIALWYDTREAVLTGLRAAAVPIPMATQSIIDSYTIPYLG